MCRLAIFNNMGIKGKWLDALTMSRGGDGNGFVSTQDIEPRLFKIGQTKTPLLMIYMSRNGSSKEVMNMSTIT
ncbi:MAG: hypothetical protein WHS64_08870 [Fervidobacterium sp.]|uniref:hypothetical protein n=1 Tax=Fervidobacterium sp. TaxID=1871331 RepID=UPI002206C7FB|nr:hypothetical protein IB67_10280 [Fervidobacterium riparium]